MLDERGVSEGEPAEDGGGDGTTKTILSCAVMPRGSKVSLPVVFHFGDPDKVECCQMRHEKHRAQDVPAT